MNQRPPVFFLVFISMFGFIGLTVIIFLWTADGFGEPPTIAKLFGTFIGLAFIAMGFGVPISALRKGNSLAVPNIDRGVSSEKKVGGYDCPSCGANVGDAEVSPSGDIKCQYCNEWWNIHRR